MKHMPIVKVFTLKASEAIIDICGWIRTKRSSKSFSFLEINDGTCMRNLQVIADASLSNYQEIEKITTGSSVKITGILVESAGKGQTVELHAREVTIFSIAPDDYPLQKKSHTLEFLRTIAHLRPRTNTIGAVTRIRNSISYAIHTFFQDRHFQYINTPIITASDCEGAGEMFRVTTLDLEKLPRTDKGSVDYSRDFFGKSANLTVSGQLDGECYATAMSKIYTFGPTFRAEKSNTPRHLAEFWMVEPEVAFADLTDNMDLAEDFLKFVSSWVMNKNSEDIDFFNLRIDDTVRSVLESIINDPFERISYTDAVKLLEKNNDKFEYPVSWGSDIQTEHERYLTETIFKKPVIVFNYPKSIKSFYMKLNGEGSDRETVRAMDVLVPRIGEIIGGSEREDDFSKLENRIKELSLPLESYWWYLDLRKYGSVPHSGFGLGLERMILLVTGMKNIRDVIPFPRFPGNAEF